MDEIHSYEGFWIRLLCGNCGETFEVDHDVSNGDTERCDECGKELEVQGR